MLTKDVAICIRSVDYSETSQIVTFFTRATGKISAIAKGCKRPKSAFDGPIEIFSHGKIVFSDSSDKSDSSREKLATLTEFEQQPGFGNLTVNLFALNCSLFAAELVNRLTDDYDPHPQLFDSFLQFLRDTNEQQDTLVLLILFQLTLLKEIGLQPILNGCANCKTKWQTNDTKRELYFSSSANGLICRDCEDSFPDKIRLTNAAAKCMTNLKLLTETEEKTLDEIERIIVHHFTELTGRPLKMAKYILRT